MAANKASSLAPPTVTPAASASAPVPKRRSRYARRASRVPELLILANVNVNLPDGQSTSQSVSEFGQENLNEFGTQRGGEELVRIRTALVSARGRRETF